MIIVQALVTALLSGLFSGAIIFALNERRERQRLMLEKAELAIESYAAWTVEVPKWCLSHLEMFGGDRQAGRAKCIASYDAMRDAFSKARTLVWIYLPERKDALQRIHEAIDPLTKTRLAILKASQDGEPLPQDHLDLITKAGKDATLAGERGLRELIDDAHAHAKSPFLVRIPAVNLPRKDQSGA